MKSVVILAEQLSEQALTAAIPAGLVEVVDISRTAVGAYTGVLDTDSGHRAYLSSSASSRITGSKWWCRTR